MTKLLCIQVQEQNHDKFSNLGAKSLSLHNKVHKLNQFINKSTMTKWLMNLENTIYRFHSHHTITNNNDFF